MVRTAKEMKLRKKLMAKRGMEKLTDITKQEIDWAVKYVTEQDVDKEENREKQRDPSLECDVSDKCLRDETSMREHVNLHPQSETYSKRFITKEQLKSHVKNDQGYYTCDHCEYSTKWLSHLKNHIQIKHEESYNHHCEECNRKFKSKNTLHQHINYVHDSQEMKCPICPKICRNKAVCFDRIKNSHISFKNCKICKKQVKEVSYKHHMRLHTDKKLHKYSYCEKKFMKRCQMREHMRIHTNERPTSATFAASRTQGMVL